MIEYVEMGVMELTRRIMQDLKSDSILNSVAIRGEISNFKYSGPHAYFSLKEGESLLNCVMFNAIYKLRNEKIQDGTMVKAYGSIRLYAKRGVYQLYTESIERGKDLGELYRQFEILKRKLSAEGVFDKIKKSIPPFPKRIAVVASRTSAAFQDVINTVKKRYPLAEILLFHTEVQGKAAIPHMIKALDAADNSNADVILLVRGGGSIEDLWNFNEELVVKKVYEMHKPVVTGVGHEIDTTLVDYVADLRAPTPTGAAERVTPEIKELDLRVDRIFKNVSNSFMNKLLKCDSDVRHLKDRLNSKSPSRMMEIKEQRVNSIFDNIKRNILSVMQEKEQKLRRSEEALKHARAVRDLELFGERIENIFDNFKRKMESNLQAKIYILEKMRSDLKAYDPKTTLKKGYSLVYKDDELVDSIERIESGDKLKIIFLDGNALADVKEVRTWKRK